MDLDNSRPFKEGDIIHVRWDDKEFQSLNTKIATIVKVFANTNMVEIQYENGSKYYANQEQLSRVITDVS